MSTIYEIPCVKGFIRMCNDGWLQGWHESGVWPTAHARRPSSPAIS